MSDQPGLQTCPASFLTEEEDADGSRHRPASAEKYYTDDPVAPLHKTASLDRCSLARRIQDNLNWAFVFNHRTSPIAPADIWREIQALWSEANEEFVNRLYEVLLRRPPEPSVLATFCAALKNEASRFAVTRTIALSHEAALCHLDLSWLSELGAVESEAVWKKLQTLWHKSDRSFVASLYPLLLARAPESEGVAAHCRAMKEGTSRASVVRAFALSDEAQLRGLSVSWLPRLEILPVALPRPPLLSLGWLKKAYRRWRNGKASVSPAASLETAAAVDFVGAAAEGRRS
jgi:Domain of unknown function (DUF4214)